MVIFVGSVVLVGWTFDCAILKSGFPALVTMKANTAFTFILAGLALRLLSAKQRGRNHEARQRIAQVCASAVALIGGLTLGEYLSGWDLGIDQLLFREELGAVGTVAPGRMAPSTALALLIVSCGLLLLDFEIPTGHRPAQSLALLSALVGLVALFGYAYGVTPFYATPRCTQMALHTALALIALSLGVLLARPDRGLMAVITNQSIGAVAARRLMPTAVCIPPLLGWVFLAGRRFEVSAVGFGVSAFVVLNITIFVAVIWWNALSLNRMDSERKQMVEALRASEERTRLIIDTAHDAFIAIDDQGLITAWNRQAETTFGWSRAEAIGKPLADTIIPARYREAHGRGLRRFLTTGEAPMLNRRIEMAALHRDGHEFPVELTITAIQLGPSYIFSSFVHDITERKRAEAALASQAQALAQSNTELKQFACVASHDLQEPLRKIIAFGDRLRTRCNGTLDEQGHEYLERMEGAARRMQALIDDLLTYSHVTTKKQPFVPVDLAKLALDVISDLEARIEQTGGRVQLSNLPTIEADPTQIRQLLQNLIANALKFHRKDEPPIVTVHGQLLNGPGGDGNRTHSGHRLCQIVVKDNGIGFDEKYRERIFNVFQRLHGRSDYEGTGIGLAICRRIAERHGGSITATSTPGLGAAFTVTLPLQQTNGTIHHG